MEDICKHCNVRIVQVNLIFWKWWTHSPEGSSEVYPFCKVTKAEPKFNNTDIMKYRPITLPFKTSTVKIDPSIPKGKIELCNIHGEVVYVITWGGE